jgi:mycofactocin precursor
MTATMNPAMDAVAPVAEPIAPVAAEPAEVVEQDLLVEDVSIDGMCGVY